MQEKAVGEARNIYNTAVDFEGRKLVVARVEADVNTTTDIMQAQRWVKLRIN